MRLQLSKKHLEAVAKGEPFRFSIPEKNIEFVVVRADVYDRLKTLLVGEDVDFETMYPLLAEISPKDWEDPSVYGVSLKT